MTHLIIVAHPAGESHVRHALAYLEGKLPEYEVIDLYKDGFDPVLRNKPTKKHQEQIKRYQDLIDAADHLIVLYPVWWNGPPAIMKGFFDCILTPGWAYHYEMTPIPKVGRPVGHLTGKRAAVISTSGALNWIHILVQHARAGKLIAHDMLGFAGMRTKRYNVGGCQERTEDNLRRIERMCDRALKWLG